MLVVRDIASEKGFWQSVDAKGIFGLIVIALSTTFFAGAVIIGLDLGTDEQPFYLMYAIGLLSPTLGAFYYSWRTSRSIKPIAQLFYPFRFGRGARMIVVLPLFIAIGYFLAVPFGLPFDPKHLPSMDSLLIAALGWSSIMWAEEIGWRGVLLPVLQKYTTPLFATIVVAIIWSIWHIPLLYILDYSGDQYFFFLLQMMGMSAVMTWGYNQSGTILVPILIHGCGNAAGGWFIAAVPEFDANSLIIVQSVGPVLLGSLIVLITKGKLGLKDP